MYINLFKRPIDFVLSLLALTLLSPVLLLVIVFLSVVNKWAGVFITQVRPGRGGKIFRVIKFKTMTDMHDSVGNLFLQC